MKKHRFIILLSTMIFLSQHLQAQQTPTWTDIEDVSITNGNITKTGPTGFDTGGAASVELLELVTNGWVKATILETNTTRWIGLSDINENSHFNTIDFTLYLTSGGQVQVYENGSRVFNSGLTYSTGQEIKVERDGTEIKYWLDNDNFYNSQIQSTLRLIVDLGLYDNASTLQNVTVSDEFQTPGPSNTDQSAQGVIQDLTWVDIENIAFIDDKIAKTTADAWDGGAASTKHLKYATDGSVEATLFETNTARMIGLSKDNPNANYNTIGYGIFTNGNQLQVYENGFLRYNTPRSYNSGQKVSIKREGSQINYYHDEELFYTSTNPTNSPLVADIALYQPGSTLQNILSTSFTDPAPSNTNQSAPGVIQDLTWTDVENIAFIADKIVKTGTVGWDNSGAASVNTISANTDGQVRVKAFETNTSRMFGLSAVNQNTHYNSIDFGIYLTNGGQVQVYEDGALKYTWTEDYIEGDELSVKRESTTIKYFHKDDLIYTSLTGSTSALIVDLSFHDDGATFQNITLEETAVIPPGTGGFWSQTGTTVSYQDGVAIGRADIIDNHKLAVQGTIISQGVRVTMNGWADYVFGENYDLKSLEELKAFIAKNKRLPEIPSETEIVREGISLEGMAVKQMQKIEELTLYLLKQDELMKEQQARIDALEKLIKAMIDK